MDSCCIIANTLRPHQHGRHFSFDIFERNWLNENIRISIITLLNFIYVGPIDYKLPCARIAAWHRAGHKPLSEPKMA